MRVTRPLTLIDIALLAYAAFVLLWFVQHLLVPDRWWPLYVLNALALYMFLPLPLLVIFGALKRRRLVLGMLLAESLIVVVYWGPLFLPNDAEPSGAPTLSVATYNALAHNPNADAVIASIMRLDADFVSLQELNHDVAAKVATRLRSRYPYQALQPRPGTTGMGILSRLPFVETGETIEDEGWVGPPQVVKLQFEGADVTVVALHAAGPRASDDRLRQASKLVEMASAHEGLLIVLGDFNSTNTNAVYARVRSVLRDAWLDAGYGLGHTFPGASRTTTPGSSRPGIGGVSVPAWLVRIDYVFYSGKHWRAIEASLGEHGGSDHRPVKAVLELRR